MEKGEQCVLASLVTSRDIQASEPETFSRFREVISTKVSWTEKQTNLWEGCAVLGSSMCLSWPSETETSPDMLSIFCPTPLPPLL